MRYTSAGASSWCRAQEFLYHLSGCLRQMLSLNQLRSLQQNFPLTVCSGGTNSLCTIPSMLKKTNQHSLDIAPNFSCFFGHEVGVFHWDDCCVVSGSCPNTQDLSPVMMVEIKLGSFSVCFLSSVLTAMQYSFWSLLSSISTNFDTTRRTLSSSNKIRSHIPYNSLTTRQTSLIVCRQPSRKASCTSATFLIMVLVEGHPLHSTPSTDVCLFLKCLNLSYVCIWPRALSPNASGSILYISAAILPSLMQIHSSHTPFILAGWYDCKRALPRRHKNAQKKKKKTHVHPQNAAWKTGSQRVQLATRGSTQLYYKWFLQGIPISVSFG